MASSTLHGPVTPVRSDKPLLKYGEATLLSNLGKRQNQKYDEFWRIQELRERLFKDRPAERGLIPADGCFHGGGNADIRGPRSPV